MVKPACGLLREVGAAVLAFSGGLRDALALELETGPSVKIIPREKKAEGFRRGSAGVF